VKSGRLWNLYGAPPNGTRVDNTATFAEPTQLIRLSCEQRRLSEAQERAKVLLQGRRSAYGLQEPPLPEASWQQAPALRKGPPQAV